MPILSAFAWLVFASVIAVVNGVGQVLGNPALFNPDQLVVDPTPPGEKANLNGCAARVMQQVEDRGIFLPDLRRRILLGRNVEIGKVVRRSRAGLSGANSDGGTRTHPGNENLLKVADLSGGFVSGELGHHFFREQV